MPSWFGPGHATWEPAALPEARYDVAYLTYNNQIWVFGGRTGANAETEVWSYDDSANAWTAQPPLPTALAPLARAAEIGGLAYIVGNGVFQSYALATGTVSALTLPTDGASRYHGLLAHDGLIYYGLAGTFFQVYDPNTGTWDDTLTEWPALGGVSRDAAQVATDGTYLYVLEGADFGRYDPATDTWSSLAAPPAGHQVAWGAMDFNNGKILLSGGWESTNGSHDDLSEYDIATDTWTSLTAMPQGTRDEHAAIFLNGRYYVIAGLDSAQNMTAIVEAWADTAPEVDQTADLQVSYDTPNFEDLEVSYDTPLVVDLEVSYDTPDFGELEVAYSTRGEIEALLQVAYQVPASGATGALQVQYRTGHSAHDRMLVTYDMLSPHTAHTFVSIAISGS